MDTTSSTAPPTPPVSSTAPVVTDRRPSPRGVIPRGVQTWLLAGLAVFMLMIMLVVGRPEPPARPGRRRHVHCAANGGPSSRLSGPITATESPRPLALAEQQAAEQAPVASRTGGDQSQAPPKTDPIAEEKRRREYESLFATNVVLSRRPEAQRPDAGRADTPAQSTSPATSASATMDEIADAALRATTRAAGFARGEVQAQSTAQVPTPPTAEQSEQSRTPERTGPISPAGLLHRILEGTIVDAVLTNRLDGTTAAPVNCLVTNPLYSHSGQQVLIPAGARLLGETKPVQSFGETRLAVTFHRLLMPDGRTYRLDHFLGLNQIGDAGLKDKVNQHYLATFGAAAAVGLISGLSQFIGSAGLGRGDGNDRTVIIAGGIGDATSQATLQVMNRFLNRLPTVTIREGHRVKVYLTSDLELPAYDAPTGSSS